MVNDTDAVIRCPLGGARADPSGTAVPHTHTATDVCRYAAVEMAGAYGIDLTLPLHKDRAGKGTPG